MVSATQLLGSYRNCIAEICKFLVRSNRAVNYVDVKGYYVDVNGRPSKDKERFVIEPTEPLYFKNWPYRIDSKERVDILAEFIETIRMSDGSCVHSTLRVNYFRLEGEKKIASDAVDYDFSEVVQDQHPICHAQSMNSILNRRPEGFPEDVDESPIANRNQSVRIPTAFVNFAGLFVKLTADHLPPETFAEFWSTCKSYIDQIPDHASNDVFDEIFAGRSLRSYSWYRW